MTNFLKLSKALLYNSWGSLFHEPKNQFKKKLLLVLTVLVLTPLMVFAGMVMYPFFAFKMTSRLFMEIILLSSSFFTLLNLILIFPGQFYYAKDLRYLRSLPIRAGTIVCAKSVIPYTYAFAFCNLLYFPAFVAWLVNGNCTVLSLIFGTLIIFWLPFILNLAAGLTIMVLMSFLNKIKDQDFYIKTVVLILFGLLLGILFYLLIQMENILPSERTNLGVIGLWLLYPHSSRFQIVFYIFFWIKPITDLLLSPNISAFFTLCLETVLLAFLYYLVSEKLYIKNAGSIAANSKKMNNPGFIQAGNKSFRAFIRLERQQLIRNPAYFFNCLMANFIFPVLLAVFITVLLQFQKSIFLVSGSLELPTPVRSIPGLFIFVGILVGLAVGSGSCICSSAFSRKGKNLAFFFYTPSPLKKLVFAELITGFLYGMAACLVVLLPFHIAYSHPLYLDIFFLLGSAGSTLFVNQLSLLIDGLHPKLVWEDENAAVRQNINVLISQLLAFWDAGFFLYLFSVLRAWSNLAFFSWMSFIVLVILNLIFLILLPNLLEKSLYH